GRMGVGRGADAGSGESRAAALSIVVRGAGVRATSERAGSAGVGCVLGIRGAGRLAFRKRGGGMRQHRSVLMAFMALVVLSGLWGDVGAQEPAPSSEPKRRLSPREAAEAVRQQADLVRRQMGPSGGAQPTSGIKKRRGVWYLVSWSIPDAELKGYLREA